MRNALRGYLSDLAGLVLCAVGLYLVVLNAHRGAVDLTTAKVAGALLVAGGMLIDPAKVVGIVQAIRDAWKGPPPPPAAAALLLVALLALPHRAHAQRLTVAQDVAASWPPDAARAIPYHAILVAPLAVDSSARRAPRPPRPWWLVPALGTAGYVGGLIDRDHGGYVDPWYAMDKVSHCLGSALVVSNLRRWHVPRRVAWLATIALGGAWELGQARDGGFASYKDFAWDVGCTLAAGVP